MSYTFNIKAKKGTKGYKNNTVYIEFVNKNKIADFVKLRIGNDSQNIIENFLKERYGYILSNNIEKIINLDFNNVFIPFDKDKLEIDNLTVNHKKDAIINQNQYLSSAKSIDYKNDSPSSFVNIDFINDNENKRDSIILTFYKDNKIIESKGFLLKNLNLKDNDTKYLEYFKNTVSENNINNVFISVTTDRPKQNVIHSFNLFLDNIKKIVNKPTIEINNKMFNLGLSKQIYYNNITELESFVLQNEKSINLCFTDSSGKHYLATKTSRRTRENHLSSCSYLIKNTDNHNDNNEYNCKTLITKSKQYTEEIAFLGCLLELTKNPNGKQSIIVTDAAQNELLFNKLKNRESIKTKELNPLYNSILHNIKKNNIDLSKIDILVIKGHKKIENIFQFGNGIIDNISKNVIDKVFQNEKRRTHYLNNKINHDFTTINSDFTTSFNRFFDLKNTFYRTNNVKKLLKFDSLENEKNIFAMIKINANDTQSFYLFVSEKSDTIEIIKSNKNDIVNEKTLKSILSKYNPETDVFISNNDKFIYNLRPEILSGINLNIPKFKYCSTSDFFNSKFAKSMDVTNRLLKELRLKFNYSQFHDYEKFKLVFDQFTILNKNININVDFKMENEMNNKKNTIQQKNVNNEVINKPNETNKTDKTINKLSYFGNKNLMPNAKSLPDNTALIYMQYINKKCFIYSQNASELCYDLKPLGNSLEQLNNFIFHNKIQNKNIIISLPDSISYHQMKNKNNPLLKNVDLNTLPSLQKINSNSEHILITHNINKNNDFDDYSWMKQIQSLVDIEREKLNQESKKKSKLKLKNK